MSHYMSVLLMFLQHFDAYVIYFQTNMAAWNLFVLYTYNKEPKNGKWFRLHIFPPKDHDNQSRCEKNLT